MVVVTDLAEAELKDDDVTVDDFLGGAVKLVQPKNGYRVSMDTVLLAASIPAKAGDKVLEPGPGSGGAALCLAERVPGVHVTGIEMQDAMVDLALRNIELNGQQNFVNVRQGCVTTRPDWLDVGTFDHVMVNPPYLANGKAIRPPEEGKGLAHMDSSANLKDWVNFCIDMVKPKGTISIVYRADRADEVIARLHRRVGELKLMPFWPRDGVAAKRVIIQGRKAINGAMSILPGLSLHGAEERYTKEAEEILRHGKALRMG